MSTRISSAILLLLLASCHREQATVPDDGERIACAHGSGALLRDCTVDRSQGTAGLVLTLRHADGGFRRLLVTRDGRGVVAADGAEPAHVTIVGGDGIEVALGNDRYRLPATIKGAKPRS